MDDTIHLNKTSLEFVRSRCGNLTVEQYVNMVLENLYTETSGSITLMPGASSILDFLERRNKKITVLLPGQKELQEEKGIEPFFRELRRDYREKVPRSVFYGRGRRAGLARNTLENAEKIYPDFVVPMDNGNVKNYINLRVPVLMTYLMQTRREVPLPLFIEKCEKTGLIKEEISIAVRFYKNLLKVEEVKDDYSKYMITDMVYDYLKAIYGNKIPASLFIKKCIDRGVAEENLVLIANVYKENFDCIIDPTHILFLVNPKDADQKEEKEVFHGQVAPKKKLAELAPAMDLINQFQEGSASITEINTAQSQLKKSEERLDNTLQSIELAEIIYNHVREKSDKGQSKEQFYLKCKERGMSDEEIRKIEKKNAEAIIMESS